jgi:hypothetical protein
MRQAIVLVVLCALAVPAAAQSKELASVTVCGTSGCRTVEHPSIELANGGDSFSDPAPPAGPYYTLELVVDEGGTREAWTIFFVPGADVVAFRGEAGRTVFELPSAGFKRAFHRYARGIQPFPTPAITRGTVGATRLGDPRSYLSLFTDPGSGDAYPAAADFVPITLHAARPSPWTDGRYLMFSPSTGSLERGTTVVRLAPATVEAIKAGESLVGPSFDGESGFAWPLVTGTLTTVLVLGLVTLLLVRRGRHAATA